MSLFHLLLNHDYEKLKKNLLGKSRAKKVNKTTGNTLLHLACQKTSHRDIIPVLLDAGANPNAQNKMTPLHFACYSKMSVSVVQNIISQGGNLTLKDGNSPLHYACINMPRTQTPLGDIGMFDSPNRDLINALISAKAPVNDQNGNTPLILLILNHALCEVIQVLLDNKADANLQNKFSPLHYACKKPINKSLIDALLKAGANPNLKDFDSAPFHDFCGVDNDFEIIQKFIEAGANVNIQNNETPLHLVCKRKPSVELIKLFYVNKFNNQLTDSDTPLHIACKYRASPEAIRALLDHGANINAEDQHTALHVACMCQASKEVVELLLQTDAIVNGVDENTPLHYAARFKMDIEPIKVLIDYGADIYFKNGKTPYDFANEDLQKVFKDYPKQRENLLRTQISTLQRNEQKVKEQSEKLKKLELQLAKKEQELHEQNEKIKSFKQTIPTKALSITELDFDGDSPLIPKRESHMGITDIDMDDVEIVKFVAKGSFKEVHKGVWLGLDVAVMKLLSGANMTEAERADFENELSMLSNLRHPNIVQFLGASLDPKNMCIIVEFCDRGDLHSYLMSKAVINDETKLELALDITKGIYFLHSNKIVHRDLKSPNILLNHKGVAKITDFGMSKAVTTSNPNLNTFVGTFNWMAPEIMYGEPYSFAADIYALGIILWEIDNRKIPFDGLSFAQLTMKVAIQGERPPLNPNGIFNDIIPDCWKRDPSERLNIKQVYTKLKAIDLKKK
ncbi:ankyrin repeat-containing protein [Anaeramoeba ignava]|uniref:Ankyrin repeat-containing protein n=1 Tax=Anaeramoeba ignava TaxID=1746090 RepID=A0A9Q0R9A8_ANAIG|nr:ankyrin repeat-containing protein [Anaeramoeba ignava]